MSDKICAIETGETGKLKSVTDSVDKEETEDAAGFFLPFPPIGFHPSTGEARLVWKSKSSVSIHVDPRGRMMVLEGRHR